MCKQGYTKMMQVPNTSYTNERTGFSTHCTKGKIGH